MFTFLAALLFASGCTVAPADDCTPVDDCAEVVWECCDDDGCWYERDDGLEYTCNMDAVTEEECAADATYLLC